MLFVDAKVDSEACSGAGLSGVIGVEERSDIEVHFVDKVDVVVAVSATVSDVDG